MTEVLIRALRDAQAQIDKRDRKLAKVKHDLREEHEVGLSQNRLIEDLDRQIETLTNQRDLAKVDMHDAEQACMEAEDRANMLAEELERAAQSLLECANAPDALAKIKDAVYGHHEYSTILWKVRQIVGPE